MRPPGWDDTPEESEQRSCRFHVGRAGVTPFHRKQVLSPVQPLPVAPPTLVSSGAEVTATSSQSVCYPGAEWETPRSPAVWYRIQRLNQYLERSYKRDCSGIKGGRNVYQYGDVSM